MALFSQNPGMGSYGEFTVTDNAVSAKYTRPTNVIVSTTGGTNQIHGTAYETARNNGLGLARARTDYFTKAPELIRNEFGINAGGPVYIPKVYNGKNRTFWFVNYEGNAAGAEADERLLRAHRGDAKWRFQRAGRQPEPASGAVRSLYHRPRSELPALSVPREPDPD